MNVSLGCGGEEGWTRGLEKLEAGCGCGKRMVGRTVDVGEGTGRYFMNVGERMYIGGLGTGELGNKM